LKTFFIERYLQVLDGLLRRI